jgi:hypothetical protein
VHHKPSAMCKKYSAEHNNGISVGFIKPSECRMAGEHIVLLRLLCLCNALKATVTSKEFIDLKAVKDASDIIMLDDLSLPCVMRPNACSLSSRSKKTCHGQVVLLHAPDRCHATKMVGLVG